MYVLEYEHDLGWYSMVVGGVGGGMIKNRKTKPLRS